jgi:TonB family protein
MTRLGISEALPSPVAALRRHFRPMTPGRFSLALMLAGRFWANALFSDEIPLGISVGRSVNMRNGSISATVQLTPLGPSGQRVQAGRVTISQARDDTGLALTQLGIHTFYSVSVGRVDDSRDLTAREPVTLWLEGVAKGAKALQSVVGKLELVIPDLDPHAGVVVDRFAARYGLPIDSPDLDGARVRLIVYDKKTAEAMAKGNNPDGPEHFDGGNMFGPPPLGLPSWSVMGARPSAMDENDLAVAISDPDSRLLSVEFQTREGLPLRYNHGGRYHSSEPIGRPDARFDVYHLEPPAAADAQLVCHLITDKALVSVPLHMENVPLPDASETRHDGGVLVVVLGESESAAKANIAYERSAGQLKAQPSAAGFHEKMLSLWSDRPGYEALLQKDEHYQTLPRLVASVPPVFPNVPPLFPRVEISVLVSFVVGEAGNVVAARVVESNDPRFNQAAVDAVQKWSFRPAVLDGKAAAAFVAVPIRFDFPTLGTAGPGAPPGP